MPRIIRRLLLVSEIFLCFLSGGDVSASTKGNYLPVDVPSSEWAQYISESHGVSDRSSIQCSSLCHTMASCNCFILVGDQCHIGSPDNTLTVLPDQAVQIQMHIDVVYLAADLALNYYPIYNASASVALTEHIFGHEDGLTELVCANKCSMVHPSCNMIIWESGRCHFADLSTLQSPGTASILGTAWTVHIGKVGSALLTTRETLAVSSAPGEQYSRHIYRTVSQSVNHSDACAAHCHLDDSKPCHFSIYDPLARECHLGTFNGGNYSVLSSSSALDVFLHTGHLQPEFSDLNSYNTESFPPYVYRSVDLSGVTNVSEHFPVCVARCQLEEDDQCQFVILDGSDCIFGSFDSGITPLPSPPSSPQRAYVVPEVTISAILTGKYHEVLGVSQNMMAPHVFDVWDNVTSVEECAALVDLRDKPIRADIGSFNQSSNQCAFGVILVGSAYTTLVPVPEYQFVDVYLRIASYGLLSHKFELFEFRPATDWAPKIYRTVPLVASSHACRVHCHLDGQPCNMYVFADPQCHLGGHNVQSNLLTGEPQRVVHYLQERIGLLIGGENGPPPDTGRFSQTLEAIALAPDDHCNNHGLPSSVLQFSKQGSAYSDPSVFLCGGYYGADGEAGTYSDECRKLDTSPRYGGRSWASMQPLPTPLASFSMAASTTSVYTFGGRTSATQCTASVHKYDIAGNTWTADFSALPSGTPSYGHCQAESDNGDFWIIGGYDCTTGTALKHAQVFNVYSESWTVKDDLLEPRYHASCGVVYEWHRFLTVNGGKVGTNQTWQVTTERWDLDLPLPNGTWEKAKDIYTSPQTYAVPFFPLAKEWYFFPKSSSFAKPYDVTDLWLQYNIGQDRFYGSSNGDKILNEVRVDATGVTIPYHDHMWTCIVETADWISVFEHNTTSGNWFSQGELTADGTGGKFAALPDISKYKSNCTNRFHFRLKYPEFGFYNEWFQENDPSQTGPVVGFIGLAITYSFGFSGLWYDDTAGGPGLIRGHPSSGQYSLGAFTNDPAGVTKIPGPYDDTGGARQVERVQLLVKKDC